MTPDLFFHSIVWPGLNLCNAVCRIPSTREAAILLTAIAGQETEWNARRQVNNGPANGWWQFELMGGVRGVMNHPATRDKAMAICNTMLVPTDSQVFIHEWLEKNDLLACAFARLLLWTDPAPLPTDPDAGWDYYVRLWRPGRPHRATWEIRWTAAEKAAS